MNDDGEITVIEGIQFQPGTAVIQPPSLLIVDEVARVMIGHPEFLSVEIAGFTDAQGNPAQNQRLSERRARAVYEALVQRGVDPKRFVVRGYGSRCPRHDNETSAGRERNRRVTFHILKTSDGTSGRVACTDQQLTPRDVAEPRPSWTPAYAAPHPEPEQVSAPKLPPLEGEYARVRKLLEERRLDDALRAALAYRDTEPQAPLSWIALGDCQLERNDFRAAARAYGSLIDLEGDPAQRRRAAGGWLEAVAQRARPQDPEAARLALSLAVDAYRKALELRPDHPSSHRLLAFALAKRGDFGEAFEVIARALPHDFDRRFLGARKLLTEDLGLLAAAWAKQSPESREPLKQRLGRLAIRASESRMTSLVATWESDTSDVDLLVTTAERVRSSKQAGLDAGDGFGPEAILLFDTPPARRLGVSLVRRGVQGHTLGKVAIVEHDGKGSLRFDDRPFVLMTQNGHADLGELAIVP